MRNLLTILFLLFGASGAYSQEAPGVFIRHTPNDSKGVLKIAKAVYESPNTKAKVILYGVIHIADKTYYNNVQRDLNSYDVVLYEGVGTPEEKRQMKLAKTKPKGFNVSIIQELMCDVLGLEFQLKAIDYKAGNLVHADMSMKQFQEMTGGGAQASPLPGANLDFLNNEQLKPLIKMGRGLLRTFLKSSPEFQNNLKAKLAEQLAQAADGKIPGMNPQMYKVLVVERNKIVLNVLREQLKTRKSGEIAIFYGAAHMPDFHQRLEKEGWKQTSKTWLSAWPSGVVKEIPEGNPAPRVRWY